MLLNINPQRSYIYSAMVLLGCILLTVYTFNETSLRLFSHWLIFDESYGHGLLVLATCIYMIHCALAAGEIYSSGPDWFMLLPLLLCSFTLALSVVAGIDMVQYILLPAVVFISFYLVAGRNAAIRILIPLGLIYFAIPFWDHFTNGLLALTSGVVQEMVYLSGITAYISGNSIYI
ncbi:MAG: archaeosortase/exosortase family protein, partial [Gammaproteobacteria bacterium]|nr:archaeosortase/exosortase family protein [Gammaproteobacteria bacterium]